MVGQGRGMERAGRARWRHSPEVNRHRRHHHLQMVVAVKTVIPASAMASRRPRSAKEAVSASAVVALAALAALATLVALVIKATMV